MGLAGRRKQVCARAEPGAGVALCGGDGRPYLSHPMEDEMKTTRALLVALLVALAATACSGDTTGPRADACPMMGSGSANCS